MTLTLGIDIGTFESKGVLADATGRVVAMARRKHEMHIPRPGWAEHRPLTDWWGDFTAITRELLHHPGIHATDVGAVACSAIGPCMLPVDAACQPLMNGVLYGVDTRAEAEIAELTDAIGPDTLIARCGNSLTSQSVGPKILWLRRNHPDIFDKTAHIHTSTSFLVHRLTGEAVIDHYTAAGFTPLYDIAARNWTYELADICDLALLPRLMWSGEVAGGVTAQAATETGLVEGTPVTVGTIDAAAEALSVGVTQPRDMMMMYGSTIFIIALTDAPVTDPRLWSAPWLFEGQNAVMAGLATSGTLTHWFRDHFARELDPAEAFEVLSREAAASPQGAKGLIALPYFSGERTPIHDPHAKGAFFGLNLTHGRGDLFRAVIEGIAFGTNHVIETFAEIGERPERVLAVGGGVQNGVWLQATSDITGLPQIVPEKTIGASLGDAFLAARAIGAVDISDLATWNPPERTIRPVPSQAYARQYPLFRRLYEQTKDIARALDS